MIKKEKVIALLIIASVCLSLLYPLRSIGESVVEKTTTSTKQTINSDNHSFESSAVESESQKKVVETKETLGSENEEVVKESTEASKGSEEKESIKTRLALNDRMQVTDWGIYDASGEKLSTSNPAISNQGYTIKFNWLIENTGDSRVQPGDYFTLLIPQNEGTLADKSDASGHWNANNSVAATPITVEINGSLVKIGEWFVEGSAEHSYSTQQIRIQFTSGVSQVTASTISGTDFSIGNQALKNYTLKAGIQNVAFGGQVQQIYFNARELKPANAFSYKNATSSGNNSVQYSIPVNLPTGNELGGDVYNSTENPKTGWDFEAENPQYSWGEHATNVHGIYVEDELEAGATLGNIVISAETRIPIMFPFTEQNPYDGTKHKGGLVSSDAAFLSYILFDSGNGPEYRTGNADGMRQKPTQETSFDRITQNEGESKSAFKARVKARDYQYGIYFDKTSNSYTVMVYFGDVTDGNNEANKLKKFSDLTSEKYAASGRTVKGTSIRVLDFAVQSADYLIKNGYYADSDRELIEDYFTMTYGDNNTLGGQVPIFSISLLVRYPPETSSERKSNTVTFYQDSQKVIDESNPQSRSVSTWLNNPYNSIQLASNEAILFKFNEMNTPMTGVKFGLQKKVGESWQTIAGKEYTTDVITVPVEMTDSEGNVAIEEQSLDGGIRTGVLDSGTYRFIELESPQGYDKTISPDYDEDEDAVVSEAFTLPASGNAPIRYVRNVSSPSYTVLHYVQQNDGSSSQQSDFDLKFQETLKADSGTTVTAKERTLAGYSYIADHSLEVKTGTVAADGSLILKLYYKIDTTVSPFSINKVNMNGDPMPSYNNRGDPLGEDNTVTFDVYVVLNYDEEKMRTTHPEEEMKTEPDPSKRVWERLVIDGVPVSITTDADGRIRDSRIDLVKSRFEETGQIQYLNSFAIVEKQTYKGYKLPDEELETKSTYWLINTGMSEDKMDAYISWVSPIGSNNPGAGKATDGDFFIKNEKKGWALYKEDMLGNPMPSFDKDDNPLEEKVTFQLYRYKENWGTYPPGEYSPADDRAWEIMPGFTYTTDSNGLIFGVNDLPTDGDTYALVETSTYSGYHCPSARQAYWILWSDGGISSCGIDNPGDRGIASYNYALKNRSATDTVLYKADAVTKRAMPSDKDQQVSFKYYKYVGQWTSTENPELNTDLTDTNNWIPLINPEYNVTDPSDDKFMFKTDEQGRLTKINELFVGSIWGETYAIQEVQTYDGYRLDNDAYWLAYIKHKTIGDQSTPFVVESMGYVPTGYPILNPQDLGNPFKEFTLTNQAYEYPTLRFQKENEKRDPMGNVEFELYEGRSDGNWDTDSKDPADENTYWQMGQPYRTAKSSLSGLVELQRLEPGYYLLMETKTAEEYQLPQGEWIITVEDVSGEIKITDIKARDGTSPPAFRVDNGNYYLPNYLKNSLPRSGGYMRLFLVILGIVLLGFAVIVLQNKKNKSTDDKGKKDEKETK